MSREVFQAEIIQTDILPDDLQHALSVSPEHIYPYKGHIYLDMGQKTAVFPDSPDIRGFLYTMMQKHGNVPSCPENSEDLFRRILTDPCFSPDMELYKKCRVRYSVCRQVVVFRTTCTLETDLFSILSTIAPLVRNDIILSDGYQSAVMIREISNHETEDLVDFTDAVIGTLEGEGITGIRAGIGREMPDASGLRRSYLEAISALHIGEVYKSSGKVYLYTKQTLERVVDCIPSERQKRIRQEFFSRNDEEPLSEEMLETIRVFFRNDLNLTAASKQLFIHRNTLNYRLDKIKKEFGLDLRSFQDAAVFQILMLMSGKSSSVYDFSERGTQL